MTSCMLQAHEGQSPANYTDFAWCLHFMYLSLHLIFLLSLHPVNLYQCSTLASVPDCSLCLVQNAGTGFQCGWCLSLSECLLKEQCPDKEFVMESGGCPLPVISSVSPNRGPPEGGTTIVISGANLGVSITDFINITVGTKACEVIESSHVPGRTVACVISSSESKTELDTSVVVTIKRTNGILQSAMIGYSFLNPVIESVSPTFGPVSGGTNVRVRGRNLDIGNTEFTRVQFLNSGIDGKRRSASPIVGSCIVMYVIMCVCVCVFELNYFTE